MEKLQTLDILPAQMDSFQSKMQAVFSQFCDSYRADLQASFKQIYELLHQRYNLEESDDGARTETSFVATAHEIVYDSSNYGLESKFGGMGVNNKIVEPNEAWTIVKPSMTLDMTPFIFAPTALLMVEQASENHSESNQQLCVKEIGLGLSENGLINIIGSAAMVVEEAIPRVKMKSLIFESKLHKITNQNTARICNYGILGRVKFRMNMHLKNNLWQFMEGFGFQILQQSSDALLFPNLGIQAYIDALAAAGVIDKFEIHQVFSLFLHNKTSLILQKLPISNSIVGSRELALAKKLIDDILDFKQALADKLDKKVSANAIIGNFCCSTSDWSSQLQKGQSNMLFDTSLFASSMAKKQPTITVLKSIYKHQSIFDFGFGTPGPPCFFIFYAGENVSSFGTEIKGIMGPWGIDADNRMMKEGLANWCPVIETVIKIVHQTLVYEGMVFLNQMTVGHSLVIL